jgi:hypothetical protein
VEAGGVVAVTDPGDTGEFSSARKIFEGRSITSGGLPVDVGADTGAGLAPVPSLGETVTGVGGPVGADGATAGTGATGTGAGGPEVSRKEEALGAADDDSGVEITVGTGAAGKAAGSTLEMVSPTTLLSGDSTGAGSPGGSAGCGVWGAGAGGGGSGKLPSGGGAETVALSILSLKVLVEVSSLEGSDVAARLGTAAALVVESTCAG